ncbi:Reverse transcriptase domain [Trinorchestia longiramus]|nr:Reverse transcriptase domain [Trinorchestia longiramus]
MGAAQHWKLGAADWTKWTSYLNAHTDQTHVSPCNAIMGNDFLLAAINSATEKSVPMSTDRTGISRATPWWDAACSKAVAQRRRAKGQLFRCPSQENLIRYKRLEAVAKRTILLKKQNSFSQYVGALTCSTPRASVWSVWHEGIIYKLMASGLEKTYVKWLKNYLTGRTISVRLGAVQSEGVPVTWGLPQGAVLSPLLFNIMLSDLLVADGVQLIIYADDITIISKGDSLPEVRACLQKYLDSLATWFKKWKLIVNPAKCSQQIFTKKHSIPDVILRLNNSVVRNVTCQRMLGIVFDAPRLTFAAHIGNLVGDLRKRLQVLRALSAARWGASRLLLRRVYIAFIRSKLEYGWPVWGELRSSSLKKLTVIQNTALRNILGAGLPLMGFSTLIWVFETPPGLLGLIFEISLYMGFFDFSKFSPHYLIVQ